MEENKIVKAHVSIFVMVLLLLLMTTPGWAQKPQTPPKVYSGSFGAGFSVTGGNTDTTSLNISADLTRDPKTRNVMIFQGLYLRSDASDAKTADRLFLSFRDNYTLCEGAFVYGAFGYLRDPFKSIGYLLNPQGGVGYKLIATDRSEFSLNGGGGAVWEKNTGMDVHASGTLNAGESFHFKVSDRASISQVVSGLWKTSDFGDALYHFGVALATSITEKAELKVEFMDDYKKVTPSPDVKRNDVAFITSFLYKF